jgi:hypothetical protein
MSPDQIQQFLIVFDIDAQCAEVKNYGNDDEAALAAYAEYEQRYRNDPNIEVVLIGADSLNTVKRTHSSYFSVKGEDSLLATA